MARVRYPLGHFPFLVPHMSDAPWGVDLATVMRWYWRVQQWTATLTLNDLKVTGTVYVDGGYSAGTLQVSSMSATSNFQGYSDGLLFSGFIPDETYLCAVAPLRLVTPSSTAVHCTLDPAGTPPHAATDISGAVGFDLFEATGDAPRCTYSPSTGLFTPAYALRGGISFDFGSVGLPEVAFSIPPLEPTPGETGADPRQSISVPVTLDGIILPPLAGNIVYAASSGGSDSVLSGTLVVALDIVPSKYWEYRRVDGVEPLYDATTGATLSPPVAGAGYP